MSIFDKCREFHTNPQFARKIGWPANPQQAKALGLYPYFIPIDHSEGTEIVIDGKRLIMIGSNNYLGLTTHPKVREASIEAIKKFGTGCTGSRFLNGTIKLHIELEERLAAFVGKPKALVFSTGYQTNLGTISSLVSKGDVVICDKEDHASIIDGLSLGNSFTDIETRFFKHNKVRFLADILKSYNKEQNKLVIVDGVFSMSGDIAPLPEIVDACKAYNASLMVDDAHSFGLLGGGRGTAWHFGCTEDVDLIMGTFSKSFASMGGFIASDEDVIEWIQHFARPFIFSASLSPSNVASVIAALDIIENEPEHVERVNKTAKYMRSELKAMGYNIGTTETAIIPIIVGDSMKTLEMWAYLFELGIYTNVALPPAVPPNQALLRTSYMATHTDEQLEKILEAFKMAKEKFTSELVEDKHQA